MFNVRKNRLDYGEILQPPVGYVLESAVGTTYSLDLATLIAVAISLGVLETTNSILINNPVCMLNALRKISDKMLIFCEAGQIKCPKDQNPLYCILEKMVIEVMLPKTNTYYPAFHPKTWVLQYKNTQGKYFYRFIVLSRNLTFDRSWDISIAFDGTEIESSAKQDEEDAADSTAPLHEFLRFLKREIKSTTVDADRKKRIMGNIISSLQHVQFQLTTKAFNHFDIMPLGIGTHSYAMPSDKLFQDNYKFHDLVVMSPFITKNVIRDLNKQERGLINCQRVLITRKSEFSKFNETDVSNFDIYTLKDDIVDGEEQMSVDDIVDGEEQLSVDDNDENSSTLQRRQEDIHAKIYLMRKDADVRLYMGSMNASHAAIYDNVEMMVCLHTKRRYIDGEKFLEEISGESKDDVDNPFELFDKGQLESFQEDTAVDDVKQLENILKKFCRQTCHAIVKLHDDQYNLDIEFSIADMSQNEADIISVRPLLLKQQQKLSEHVHFLGVKLEQLSAFYCVKVEGTVTVERVMMIPTEGIPEIREDAIVQSVIKDRSSFMEYLAFSLGDNYVLSQLETKRNETNSLSKGNREVLPAVYEKMLKTALHDPAQLKDICYLMDKIHDDAIIPQEFRRTYDVFKEALQ